MPRVTVIPASVNPFNHMPSHTVQKRRVAGYARVSTDSDEQFTSYEAQVDYYTEYIQSRSDWEFVSVYTDEGISGCSTRHREGFPGDGYGCVERKNRPHRNEIPSAGLPGTPWTVW